MTAACTICGRTYNIPADSPPPTCVACGGTLKPLTDAPTDIAPAPPSPPQTGTIDLADESPAAGMTCPNCGKWIEPGAQICTACGYSRRLARTLTTRVGTPEILKPKSRKSNAPEAPEIEAEKSYRRAKERSRIASGDALRLLVALLALLALAAFIITAPTHLLDQLKKPPLLQPPKFDAPNATLMMLLFLGLVTPITAIGVRIAAALTNTEISKYFNWLRTAGALAAALLALELAFTLDQTTLHLPTPLLLPTLAAVGAIALLLFTWYLHDVNLTAAILLALATLVIAAAALIAATAAFGWLANFLGIDPVIRLHNLLHLSL